MKIIRIICVFVATSVALCGAPALALMFLLNAASASAGPIVYENFDYTLGTKVSDGNILGAAGDGFSSGWAFSGLTGEVVANLNCGGVKTTGNALKITSVTNAVGTLFRGLDSALTNGTYFMSVVFYRNDTNNGGSENWRWELRESASYSTGPTSDIQISAGSTSAEQASLQVHGDSLKVGTASYTIGDSCFMLVKCIVDPNGSEIAYTKIYTDGDSIPTDASNISWDATSIGSFSSAAGLKFILPTYIPNMVLDEFRIGTGLADVVTYPENSLAGSGAEDFQEVLQHTLQSVSLHRICLGADDSKYVSVDMDTGYADDTPVELKGPAQAWVLEEIDAAESLYRIRCEDSPSYYLRANALGDGWDNGDPVQIHSWMNWNSQKWVIEPETNGLVRIRSYGADLYLHAGALVDDTPLDLTSWQGNDLNQMWGLPIVGNIQEPNMAVGTDGSLLASFKYLFGGNNNGMLYASLDSGKTWTLRHQFSDGVYGQTVFSLNNALYMFYRSSNNPAQLRIAKSTDHGYSWNTSVLGSFSADVIPGGGTPVLKNGVIYFAFTDEGGSGGWPEYFRLRVASCATNLSLTSSANWQFTDFAEFPFSPAVGGRTADGWLEPQCVLGPDGKVWVLARVNSPDSGDVSAVLKVSIDRTELEFNNQYEPSDPLDTGFIYAPWAGGSRFHILYDEISERYLMLSSPYLGSPSENDRHRPVRNMLALYESHDLKHFSMVKTLIVDDAFEDWRLSSWFSGFQYPSAVIDGDDLHYISRTAYKTFDNQHDANSATVHMLENFRDYLSTDGEVAFYSFDSSNYPGANSAKMGGSDADIYGAAFTSSGKYEGCLSFDGTDDWLGLLNRVSPKLNQSKQVCISVWLKPDGITSPGAVFTSPINGISAGITLQWLYDKIILSARSRTSDSLQTRRFNWEADGQWHHVVALWDFENDTMRLWVDKAEQSGTETVSFGSDAYIREAPSVQDAIGKHFQGMNYFHGAIDEFRIYNRALNEAEIGTLYDGATECRLNGTFSIKNRQPYYKFYLAPTDSLETNVKDVGIKAWGDGTDRKWSIVPATNGATRCYIKLGENWYLRGGFTNESNVTLVYRTTVPEEYNNFRWRILYDGDGQYRIQSALDDYLRADADGSWEDGDNVMIYEWNSWNSQRWLLYPED